MKLKILAPLCAVALSAIPAGAAPSDCQAWNAAVEAASQDNFASARGEKIAPYTYKSKLTFREYSCQITVTNGTLMVCSRWFLSEAMGRKAYADAATQMSSCLSGWTSQAFDPMMRVPPLAGQRLGKLVGGVSLSAGVILLGPTKYGSTEHLLALTVSGGVAKRLS